MTYEPKCPFYGFHFSKDELVMISSKGNQCALKTIEPYTRRGETISPCSMEFIGETSNWTKCPYNSLDVPKGVEKIEEIIKQDILVYPKEKEPNIRIILLKDWIKKVMGSS